MTQTSSATQDPIKMTFTSSSTGTGTSYCPTCQQYYVGNVHYCQAYTNPYPTIPFGPSIGNPPNYTPAPVTVYPYQEMAQLKEELKEIKELLKEILDEV